MTLLEYKELLVVRMSQLRKDIEDYEDRTGGDPKYLKSHRNLQNLKMVYDDVRRTLNEMEGSDED